MMTVLDGEESLYFFSNHNSLHFVAATTKCHAATRETPGTARPNAPHGGVSNRAEDLRLCGSCARRVLPLGGSVPRRTVRPLPSKCQFGYLFDPRVTRARGSGFTRRLAAAARWV